MTVRWVTGFIDRPPSSFEAAATFWAAVTGSDLSAMRGSQRKFASLRPPDGDAYLRLQRVVEGRGGCHLDLHVEDVAELAERAVAAGAVEMERHATFVVLRSPTGMPWCAVPHRGEQVRPAPQPAGNSGHLHLVDQVCIDIPATRFDEECAFWSRVTGWGLRDSSARLEFRYLVRPEGLPLRLLLQRCDERQLTGAHLDLASSDVPAVAAHHERLGARITAVFEHWTLMADPSATAYCVTARDPHTGRLGPSSAAISSAAE